MDMQPVTSSNIAAVGYHPPTRTLVVRFHDRSVYWYAAVPPESFAAMLAAPRPGQFLHRSIIPFFDATRQSVTQRYRCGRCGDYSSENTATACVACGASVGLLLVDLTTDPDGAPRLTTTAQQADTTSPVPAL